MRVFKSLYLSLFMQHEKRDIFTQWEKPQKDRISLAGNPTCNSGLWEKELAQLYSRSVQLRSFED